MWYILSFAFQLSGGLILLLLWVFTDTNKKVDDSYYSKEAIARPDNNNMCTQRKERLQEIAADIYRNRFAFSDLCVGYLIAVVAEKTLSSCVNFISVVIITGIITGIEYYFAEILSKRNFPEDRQIPSSELNNVPTTATSNETTEMLGEVLNGEKNVQ